jgi:hypothetical protein
MPTRVIPCGDCEEWKEDLSSDWKFVSCHPIDENPGFCLFVYERRQPAASAKVKKAPATRKKAAKHR